MSLREEILSDYSKTHVLKIAEMACGSKKLFRELITCFLDDSKQLSQRAAWSVGWAARKNPDMIRLHTGDLVRALKKKNAHDAVARNAMRVLQEIDIPENYQGEVMDLCFRFLENPSTAVAIKAFSLTTLSNLSKIYPEIKPELKLLIEERWEHETAAFRSRAKNILAQMEKASLQ